MSSKFPYQSKFINIIGSKIHYIDENNSHDSNQTVFVLVHGNPSSNYLWRNIIPHLLPHGRIIAPDLIGFGKSDKPDIDYKVATHLQYFDAFISELNLKNIVFVLHDWGTALGLSYARRFESKIKGVVFMEGIVKPKKWDFSNIFVRSIFRLFRIPIIGKWMIINNNFFVERILLGVGTNRKLSKNEKEYYRKPFFNKKDRKPVYVFPNEIPIHKNPSDVFQIVNDNHNWLKTSDISKLLLWIKPGVLIMPKHVEEMEKEYPNLRTQYIGKASHYLQEDIPNEIGKAITKWHENN